MIFYALIAAGVVALVLGIIRLCQGMESNYGEMSPFVFQCLTLFAIAGMCGASAGGVGAGVFV